MSRVDSTQAKLVTDLSPQITVAVVEPAGGYTAWALESYQYARDVAYTGIGPAQGKIR